MKKISTFLTTILIISFAFLSGYSNAQAPGKMSYQTVIRNASGNLVTNQSVGIKISILQTSATGTAVYVETHAATTNANGLVSLQIGGGTVVFGSVSGIDWSAGPYFVKTETDPAGGTNYTITGTSELLSVPYALYAANVPAGNWLNNGSDISNANSGNVGIGTASPVTKLDVNGTLHLNGDSTSFYFPNFSSSGNTIISGVYSGKGTTALGPQLRFDANSGANSYDVGMNGNLGFTIEENNNARITISPGGMVGIGTIAPNTSLQIGDFNTTIDNYISVKTSGPNLYKAGIGFYHNNDSVGWLLESDDSTADFSIRHRNGQWAFNEKVFTINSFEDVGIGTATPEAKLHVAGNIKITDGTQGQGRVLTSDINGLASWQIPGTGVGFKVEATSNQTFNCSGSYEKVNFGTVVYDKWPNYSTSLNLFIASSSGLYHFDVIMICPTGSAGSNFQSIDINVNGLPAATGFANVVANNAYSIRISESFYLNALDTVFVQVLGNAGSTTFGSGSYARFSGYKVW